MTAISRRSNRSVISRLFTLATADDLDGTIDNTQAVNVTGAARVIILTITGTPGTAGIDVLEVSHDEGSTWAADDTLMAIDANDSTGSIVASAALEAAGVESTTLANGTFKSGPYHGRTALRIGRKTTDTRGTTWITGAPLVQCFLIGQTSGVPSALA